MQPATKAGVPPAQRQGPSGVMRTARASRSPHSPRKRVVGRSGAGSAAVNRRTSFEALSRDRMRVRRVESGGVRLGDGDGLTGHLLGSARAES